MKESPQTNHTSRPDQAQDEPDTDDVIMKHIRAQSRNRDSPFGYRNFQSERKTRNNKGCGGDDAMELDEDE